MDLFKKFTMKALQTDGSMVKVNNREAGKKFNIEDSDLLLSMSDNSTLDKLLKQMRYINKVLCPAFIRDWCLKCSHYL